MTIAGVAILVVFAAAFANLKWCRTSRILYAISVIFFLAIGCGPVPLWLLRDLQSAYAMKPVIKWGRFNAIVLLGAGADKSIPTGSEEPSFFSYGRILETVRLYNSCRKTKVICKIVISGGDAKDHGTPEATVYCNSLLKLGIDASDISLESASMNTWQNAQFTSAALRRLGADHVLLVSSGIHLRRSMLYFAYFGVAVTPVRADYLRAVLSPLPLAYNFAAADFALHEYVGIVRYHVYNALGWNSQAQHSATKRTQDIATEATTAVGPR
jgi:uncharacterized SAM-binding protein YcdF (DUF218 family)